MDLRPQVFLSMSVQKKQEYISLNLFFRAYLRVILRFGNKFHLTDVNIIQRWGFIYCSFKGTEWWENEQVKIKVFIEENMGSKPLGRCGWFALKLFYIIVTQPQHLKIEISYWDFFQVVLFSFVSHLLARRFFFFGHCWNANPVYWFWSDVFHIIPHNLCLSLLSVSIVTEVFNTFQALRDSKERGD